MATAKASVLTTRRLGYAMEGLSKRTLIDMVVDRVRAEIGEGATDEAILATVQEWLGPVAHARGDKPTGLAGRMKQWDKAAAEHIAKHGDPNACADMIANHGGHE